MSEEPSDEAVEERAETPEPEKNGKRVRPSPRGAKSLSCRPATSFSIR